MLCFFSLTSQTALPASSSPLLLCSTVDPLRFVLPFWHKKSQYPSHTAKLLFSNATTQQVKVKRTRTHFCDSASTLRQFFFVFFFTKIATSQQPLCVQSSVKVVVSSQKKHTFFLIINQLFLLLIFLCSSAKANPRLRLY